MVAGDPLGEVKKAIVAVCKLPEDVCGSGAEQYFERHETVRNYVFEGHSIGVR